ncbi:MAG: hypothetical protein U0W65_15445 [Bacteroidia bacterium]
MEPTEIKIQEALQNANEWIAHLATRSDAELVRRLDTNAFQYEIAYKNSDVKLCEFMDIMHRILVEARIYKDEHQIPDEISEITLEVSQMEHVIAQEEVRQEVLESFQPQRISKPKIQEDNSSQMSLF